MDREPSPTFRLANFVLTEMQSLPDFCTIRRDKREFLSRYGNEVETETTLTIVSPEALGIAKRFTEIAEREVYAPLRTIAEEFKRERRGGLLPDLWRRLDEVRAKLRAAETRLNTVRSELRNALVSGEPTRELEREAAELTERVAAYKDAIAELPDDITREHAAQRFGLKSALREHVAAMHAEHLPKMQEARQRLAAAVAELMEAAFIETELTELCRERRSAEQGTPDPVGIHIERLADEFLGARPRREAPQWVEPDKSIHGSGPSIADLREALSPREPTPAPAPVGIEQGPGGMTWPARP